jgi:hypothetical protein
VVKYKITTLTILRVVIFMDAILTSRIHRLLANTLELPFSAINVLSYELTNCLFDTKYLVYFEFNENNQGYSYIYLDKIKAERVRPLVKVAKNGAYYFTTNSIDSYVANSFNYGLTPERINICPKFPYEDYVKKNIALSLLDFFSSARVIYPWLFADLSNKYFNFFHSLISPNNLNTLENREQDYYIKLLTILNQPCKEELIYYTRLLELNGWLSRLSPKNKLEYCDLSGAWRPFTQENKRAIAIKFANEIKRNVVKNGNLKQVA